MVKYVENPQEWRKNSFKSLLVKNDIEENEDKLL